MNKICTSIEQSLKLIELGLDINTADMWYQYIGDSFNHIYDLEDIAKYFFELGLKAKGE